MSLLGPKPVRSVAAFLWMPQFRLSFQQMSYLGPVFVRTLANVFAQSGLLPRNHPALMYGAEGVEKHGFRSVMGQAWFTLRTTRATADQWGIFIGVMLMMAMIVGAFVTTMMTTVFGMGTSAQAQIFSHPLGDSSAQAHTPMGAFDTGVPAAGTPQGDYGIMMLDKAIRAGAYGKGTALQNATRALMEVYNSGVLVVAAVIVFWMIISVVVDTAKTGQIGGGRHNMVWTPIRVVFALALIFPLGSAGYSSGQFIVMKIAEWGSNFATRGWVAYVDAVSGQMNMTVGSDPQAVSEFVFAYSQMWVCRIAANSAIYTTTGGATSGEVVLGRAALFPGTGKRRVTYTNDNYENLCGSITYELPDNAIGALDVVQPAQYFARQINNLGQDPLTRAMDSFKNSMRVSYMSNLDELTPQVRDLACKFVDAEFSGNLSSECSVTATEKPSIDELKVIIGQYGRAVTQDFRANYLGFRSTQDQLVELMKERGWAGMGLWYHKISQLNEVVASVRQPTINVTVGGLASQQLDESWSGWAKRALGFGDDWLNEAQTIVLSYKNWWRATPTNVTAPTTSKASEASTPAAGGQQQVGPDDLKSGSGDMASIGTMLEAAGVKSDVNNILWGFGFDIRDYQNTYPMAIVANAGNNVALWGLAVIAAITGIQAASAASVFWSGFVGLTLFQTLIQIGFIMVGAGMALKYYVPLIPFIRVIFAVLTWIISVFEAVALVPIAALAFLSTQGEGFAGNAGNAFKLWLSILMRPILTVVAFIGALLVFNAFVSYVNDSFLFSEMATRPTGFIGGIFGGIFIAILYIFIIFTTANTVFKMLDLVPNAFFKWIGASGGDTSFDSNDERSIMLAASNFLTRAGSFGPRKKEPKEKPKEDPDGNPNTSKA